jgi:hypothetical protein
MLKTVKSTLALSFALLFWYIGASVLIWKGHSLAQTAIQLESNIFNYLTILTIGICIAILKTKLVFFNSAHKNINRILQLKNVQWWNIFSGKFVIALIIMVTAGVLLSRFAQGQYYLMIAIALLDFSIGFALIFSSYPYGEVLFFKRK